ncbi:MAG: DUF4129 domain-containing protein [Planctomycetes bacterium]|nr:DUF4129 domain-containing protein [Planctomycetota bacterium]MCH9727188.1 DUF4129 domain-containing protein [Planctomycetota bacterium]MCH9778581.1 DUF4129 domain-containing protein [Planctomycetota bacterium]MCH9793255.1 DUF4129 domain-containing protein [Planctomycetota bacterium]
MTCYFQQGVIHKIRSILIVTASLSLLTTTAFSQPTKNAPFDIDSPDRAMIEQDTKEILKRPEFRHLTRERQITTDSPFDLEELIKEEPETNTASSGSFIADFAGSIIMLFSYFGIICACGLIVYLLYRSLTGFRFSDKIKDKSPPDQLQGELTLEEIISPAESEASTYLQRAKKLAQTGDYHNAIIQLLYGSMSFIERSGWIRFRKGLTYRDYLRATRPHGLPSDSFRQMIRTYEPLGFGRREATREHFESTLSHYEAAFQKKA